MQVFDNLRCPENPNEGHKICQKSLAVELIVEKRSDDLGSN